MTRRQMLGQLMRDPRRLVVPRAPGAARGVSVHLGALLGLMLLATGCAAVGDPDWQVGGSSVCRQTYGTRGSTSATRPDLVFLCAESP